MKKLLLLTIVLLFVFTFLSNAQTDTVTILHVNDTHSCLSPLAPRNESLQGKQGGIARAATVIGMIKMEEKNVLTLHAGDFSIGDLLYNFTFGVAELQIMKSLGFDAIALGNHEFDLTPEALSGTLSTAFADGSIPVLSSNIIMEDSSLSVLKNYVKDCAIKEYGQLKVGIFSLLTPETMVFSLPSPVVIDTNLAQCAAAMVEKLTNEGCGLIICLSHLGVYYDQMIAQNIPGINIIVSGHDHLVLQQPIIVENPLGKNVLITQADAFYTHVGKMKLEVTNGEVKLLDYQLIPLDENVPENPDVKQIVDGVVASVESTIGMPVFTQQIGIASEDFEEVATPNIAGEHDTPVGNLVTDAFIAKTGTQIAMQLGGSTAQKLYKGPIVAADVFRMLGYGFNTVNALGYRLATFKITGEELWKGLEVCVSQAEFNDEMLAQTAGMKYSFDINNPKYSRITSVEINGSPLDPAATYTVTANELLINALPLFGVAITDVSLMENITEFQVVLDYIISRGSVSPVRRNTVTDTKDGVNSINQQYTLEQNYPNPFNPTTSILFSIPVQEHVSLKVYNVLGQEVATLVNETLNAGIHKIDWNAGQFASGVYIYRIQSNNFTQVRKMILIK